MTKHKWPEHHRFCYKGYYINVSNFTSYFLRKYKFGTVKKLQNQNILFNERNIIKHSFFSGLFCLFVFQLCRLHVLYSCCLNVLSPKKEARDSKKTEQEELLLLKQIERKETGNVFSPCPMMPVNSVGISLLPKRSQRRKNNIFLVIVKRAKLVIRIRVLCQRIEFMCRFKFAFGLQCSTPRLLLPSS